MKSCEYSGQAFPEARSHPWSGSSTDPHARYYDFTESPQLISSALEDFVPWAHYGAVHTFYALLQRLNHPRGKLASSDCELSGPHPNEEPEVPKAQACSGRLMLLFRALERNTDEQSLEALKDALHRQLYEQDEAFQWGMVGTTLVPTRYLALPNDQQLGNQLMISFWAWGNDEADTMSNLDRLFTNLSHALRQVTARA